MPSIYVGTYAKYNSGSIDGKWLDLSDYVNAKEFYAACAELHDDESDPEFMFQDWEDIPKGMIGESWLSPNIWEWLELSDDDKELLAVYRENVREEGTIEQAREAFIGSGKTRADICEQWFDDVGINPPDEWALYIDWEKYARDMSYGDWSFVEHDGETWAFSNNI